MTAPLLHRMKYYVKLLLSGYFYGAVAYWALLAVMLANVESWSIGKADLHTLSAVLVIGFPLFNIILFAGLFAEETEERTLRLHYTYRHRPVWVLLEKIALASLILLLASCRRHCETRGLAVNLYVSDLQNLALPHRYEAIIIPAGSFLLIEQREASLNALKRLYDHLQPGGRLMLDLFLPDPDFECGYKGTSTFNMPSGDIITMESKLVEADLFNQYKVTHLKYEKWRDGALIQTELQRFAVRWYGVEEFKLVLESIGFTDVVVSADFEFGKAPTNGQQVYVYEATRR